MEAKFSFAVVGAFVLVFGAALIGGVLWLSSGRYYGKAYDTYRSYMSESVSGLNLNAPVKYRGVDVGFVREIALDAADPERVELTLAIAHGTPVKEDTVAVLQTQGLTGIAYLELTGGRKESPPLAARAGESYPVIRSGPSLFLRLDTAVTGLIDKLSRSSDRFSDLLDDENRRAIAQTLADLQLLSRTLAKRSETIDRTLVEAERATAGAARFAAQLPQLAQRLERSADAFDRMTQAIAAAGASTNRMIDDNRADVARFTAEGLPELRMLIAELREAAGTLSRVGTELERNPSQLIWGRAPARRGPGE